MYWQKQGIFAKVPQMKRWISYGAILLFFLIDIAVVSGAIEFDLATVQLIFAPLVVFLISTISISDVKVPWKATLIALLLVFACFLFVHSTPSTKDGPILVARFDKDPFNSQSYIFKNNLNEVLAQTSEIETKSLSRRFQTQEEAKEYLSAHKGIAALIWGSKRWLNVNFQREKAFELSQSNCSSLFDYFSGLKLINNVSWIGLSYEPLKGTTEFLGNLFAGQVPLEQYAIDSRSMRSIFLKKHLIRAGTLWEQWTSPSHKGLPLMLLGNYLIVEALQHPQYEPEMFKKAIKHYSSALLYVKTEDNPQLHRAVYSNLGIATYIRSRLEKKSKGRKLAVKLLKKAVTLDTSKENEKDQEDVIRVAVENLELVKEKIKNRRKSKKLKQINGTPKPNGVKKSNRLKKKQLMIANS